MPSLTICKFPEPVLRRVCDPVSKIDGKLKSFIERLIETMRRQPGGIGIAAPQVGVLKKIAIVDVSPRVPGAEMHVLINPVIVRSEKEEFFREGCMSLPDYTANVKRAERIKLKWLDIDLAGHEEVFDGLEARCIQHEVDHLNGILFVDRVAS